LVKSSASPTPTWKSSPGWAKFDAKPRAAFSSPLDAFLEFLGI
jgi:hypothetical protein